MRSITALAAVLLLTTSASADDPPTPDKMNRITGMPSFAPLPTPVIPAPVIDRTKQSATAPPRPLREPAGTGQPVRGPKYFAHERDPGAWITEETKRICDTLPKRAKGDFKPAPLKPRCRFRDI